MNKIKISLLTAALVVSGMGMAGNENKRGQAGATELLMNPWTKTAGLAGANVASVRGIDAMRFNVAGIVDTAGISFAFSHTQWYAGSGISTNAVGFTKSLPNKATLGVSIMNVNFGEFIETTVDRPEGTGITFKPQFFNIGFAYSKQFSKSVRAGLLARVIQESIQNARATGIAFDAGIQYEPESMDRFRFGVAIRNVGSNMRYSGDGLSFRGTIDNGNEFQQTLNVRVQKFDIPSLFYISASYDLVKTEDRMHLLSFSSTFNSNTYTYDRFLNGFEYTYNNLFVARFGFDYYKDMFSSNLDNRLDAFSGIAAGFSVMKRYGDTGRGMSIDYAYRSTYNFNGNHSLGLSFDF